MIHNRAEFVLVMLAVLALGLSATSRQVSSSDEPRRLDPAAWGSDHVGQPIPEYATGEQCLFCHRVKVGPTWGANRHQLTIREIDDRSPALAALKESTAKSLAGEIKLVMGDLRRQRFLKPAQAYGKLEMLSAEWAPSPDKNSGTLINTDRPHWDANQFGDSCAGCHATAVDPKERSFSAVSLDCYVCHGNVPSEHTQKPELVYLSPHRQADARLVTSICAQCHVRTGKSKSTGRPYPNNFVAGDNLFRDFVSDFSDEAIQSLSTADGHVLENVRDVVIFGNDTMTCQTCHDVHGRSSQKHQLVAHSDLCLHCHNSAGPQRDVKPLSNHSRTCGY